MSGEKYPSIRSGVNRYAPKKPEQHLRLLRHEGMPVVREDEEGTLRYVYDDFSIDPRSTVDPRLDNFAYSEYTALQAEPCQEPSVEAISKLGAASLIAR